MSPKTEVPLLAWDSEWLDFPVARFAAGPRCAAAEVRAAVAQARAAGIRLLYLVLEPGNAPAAAAALASGAWLVDSKRTYQQPLPTGPLPTAPSGINLTLSTTDTPELWQLAVQSGEYSRFRRDARIGPDAFEELYGQWLRRSLAQGLVWSAALANDPRPVGMLAFDASATYASIELLAVTPAARRHGIGRQLVQAARRAALRHGFSTLQVVTQELNQPACRFYERCGFELRRVEHIYHLWL